MMDDKEELAFFQFVISAAQDMIDKLGDVEKLVKKFRGCYAGGMKGFSDAEILFMTGFVSGFQSAIGEMGENLEQMSIAEKEREMFTVRDAGRGYRSFLAQFLRVSNY
jgi:hypothetical protein